MPNVGTVTPLMNLLNGTVRSQGYRSADCRPPVPHASRIASSCSGTINLRLGAVRRLAYEAADCGLLSPDLAAGIRRVKGVKKIGVRLGNWLTTEQSQTLWQSPNGDRLKEKRDRALLALLLACGLRRHEAVDLDFGHVQQREEHWAMVDLKGKAGHNNSNARMGKGGCRSVAPGSEHLIREVVSTCA
jgi:site-specific recombinase XerC